MSTVSRRTFVAGAAAAAATATLGRAPSAHAAPPASTTARRARVRLTRERHRVVVIGSGFGGGVSAARLAQAGVPVTVLERGRRWPTGPNSNTFPTLATLDKRVLWHRSVPQVFGRPVLVDPYVGLLETVAGDNITAVCAAGVGGGSLVYQGMTLKPDQDVFESVLPEQLDYRRMSRIHYPRVARMLQVQTAPDTLIESPAYRPARVFARNVRRSGYHLSKIPMPIDWTYALRELEGDMKPSYTDGSCALGVNNGGKHSVDVTYIAAAEATGLVTVQTQHEVTDVARAGDGSWQVHVNVIDQHGSTIHQKIITAGTLIMAAGTMGTTRLLMRAQAKGLISDLPEALGTNWGSNGDRIYLWSSLEDDFGEKQGGPVIYGSKEWDTPATANTLIQASFPPIGADLRSTMMVGFGVSDVRGRFVYDATKDDAVLHWPSTGDARLYRRIGERAQQIAGPLGFLTDTNGLVNTTWHPLGGAAMGSVCDLDGRVKGTKGLYVLDGALIPGTTAACNPSMTIAAVAERALDNLVADDVGRII
jgi:cholesterol oxidase